MQKCRATAAIVSSSLVCWARSRMRADRIACRRTIVMRASVRVRSSEGVAGLVAGALRLARGRLVLDVRLAVVGDLGAVQRELDLRRLEAGELPARGVRQAWCIHGPLHDDAAALARAERHAAYLAVLELDVALAARAVIDHQAAPGLLVGPLQALDVVTDGCELSALHALELALLLAIGLAVEHRREEAVEHREHIARQR